MENNKLNNRLTERQQNVFLDIYKTVLHAEMSNPVIQDFDSECFKYTICDALRIAMNTVNLLFDKNGEFKSLDSIKSGYSNMYDKFTRFPDIESETEQENN